jgi:4'-phosphopantetheinyl transferase
MTRVLLVNISHATEEDYRQLYQHASQERRERADRYLRREDALRCVAAHALLCYVTGRNDLPVTRTPEGKPYLPDMPDFHFNLTHSGDYVAIAYGQEPVGVDIEQIRADGIRPGIAQRFFSPAEQETAATEKGFFQIWSMKESYVKCLGTGLSYPMRKFDVLAEPLAMQFLVQALPGYVLTAFSSDAEKKVESLPLSQLIAWVCK